MPGTPGNEFVQKYYNKKGGKDNIREDYFIVYYYEGWFLI